GAAEDCAAGLAAAGVAPGDVVCHLSPNGAEVVVTMLALIRLGAIECPVNAGLRGHQLAHVLAHSSATTLVVDGRLNERVAGVLADAPGIERGGVRGAGDVVSGPRVVPYDEVRAGGGRLAGFRAPDPGDPLNIIYTSGTTGPAKGAVLPHGFPVEQAAIKV